MKTFNFTLEDLGLEMFHDRWKRVKLWRMEEYCRLEGYAAIRAPTPDILQNKRYRKAYDMRMKGYTYKVIGEAIGVSLERARQVVKKFERALKRTGEYAL